MCEDRGIEQLRPACRPSSTASGHLPAADRALLPGRRALQLRPVPFPCRKRTGPSRPDELTPELNDRRQASQGNPRQPVLSRQPLRVLRPARRNPRPGLRAIPRQGHPPDRRTPRRGRGKARSHARPAASTTRRTYIVDYIVKNTVGKLLRRARRPKPGLRNSASSTPPAAPARSCSARIKYPAGLASRLVRRRRTRMERSAKATSTKAAAASGF